LSRMVFGPNARRSPDTFNTIVRLATERLCLVGLARPTRRRIFDNEIGRYQSCKGCGTNPRLRHCPDTRLPGFPERSTLMNVFLSKT
jgi:hypothetical protein